MFFGSGNLIFPPFVGYQAGAAALPAFLGFALTAVVLPVLGVAAVAKAGGLDRLCERVHPKFSLFFSVIIYLCIGPMLAIPRTASTSYSMFAFLTDRLGQGTVGGIPVQTLVCILFSFVFFLLAGMLAKHPERLKDVLGSVTLPLERIAKAPIFRFAWKDGSGESAGSSAQYWRSALPAAVRERDGYLEMQYGNIALISAVAIARETLRLASRVSDHERRIRELEAENRRLRATLAMTA